MSSIEQKISDLPLSEPIKESMVQNFQDLSNNDKDKIETAVNAAEFALEFVKEKVPEQVKDLVTATATAGMTLPVSSLGEMLINEIFEKPPVITPIHK